MDAGPLFCYVHCMSVMNLTSPSDPSEIGFPVNLPLEIAMGDAPVKTLCLAYGLSKSDWMILRDNPQFIKALEEAYVMLQQEGAMFRVKIKAQAEGVLARNWAIIHGDNDKIPASVQAEQIRFTIRAAGLDASVEQKAKAQGSNQNTNALQINLVLGD